MAFYHFVAIEVIVPYSLSYARVAPLIPLGLVLLPIFLRTRRVAPKTMLWLGVGLAVTMVTATCISAFLLGFNEADPRMQNLVIRENAQPSESVWVSETYGTDGLAALRPINSAPEFYGDRIEIYQHLVLNKNPLAIFWYAVITN